MLAADFRTPLSQFGCLNFALRLRDFYTEGHCARVKILSLRLGMQCRLTARELVVLRDAAILHDIGKIGIPDGILLKPGKFEPDEWEVMKTHTELGQSICATIPRSEMLDVGRIVRNHHEAFDGGGYPDGLAGEEIPAGSRIIAVADAYDAMTTARPYHPAKTHQKAMEVLRSESGKRVDPHIFRQFETIIADSEYRAH